MISSKTLQVFAKNMEFYKAGDNVIVYPDKYLWPNTNLVLDFWAYLDTLSHEDMGKIRDKVNQPISSRNHDLSRIAEKVVGEKVLRCIQLSAGSLACLATCELLAYHCLLDLDWTLTFVPLFEKYKMKKAKPW